jgi:hypothetical protein
VPTLRPKLKRQRRPSRLQKVPVGGELSNSRRTSELRAHFREQHTDEQVRYEHSEMS